MTFIVSKSWQRRIHQADNKTLKTDIFQQTLVEQKIG